jgi:hypothetical protein
MARKKTCSTPSKYGVNEALIQVRKAIDKGRQAQRLFAKAAGINQSTYQKTEEGHRLLEMDEAIRIMSFTGADAESLIKGRKAKTLDKRDYTKAAFKQWRERAVDEKAVCMAAKRAGLLAEALVRSSRRQRPSRYSVVVEKLFEYFGELERKFDLRANLENELKENHGKTRRGELAWSALTKMLHLDGGNKCPTGWNVKEAARVPASKRLEVEHVEYPVFERMAVGSFGKQAFTYDAIATSRVLIRVKLPWSPNVISEFKLFKGKGFIALSGKSEPIDFSVIEMS